MDIVRIQRAFEQPLYLIEARRLSDVCIFQICGSTGNAYTVEIGSSFSCNCLDFMRRKLPCKHIIFAFGRVMQQPITLGNLHHVCGNRELRIGIFAHCMRSVPWSLLQQGVQEVKNNRTTSVPQRAIEGSCPICFEDLASKSVVYCKSSCGNNVHELCFKKWRTHQKKNTCIYCRADMY